MRPSLAPSLASADTKQIDLGAIPGKTVHKVATLKPLALTDAGTPLVVTLELEKGKTVPPHAVNAGLRLLTVVQGTLFWGDGDTVDQTAEATYPAGSFLVVQPGENHWLAARQDDLTLQLVVMPETAPTPPVLKQLN